MPQFTSFYIVYPSFYVIYLLNNLCYSFFFGIELKGNMKSYFIFSPVLLKYDRQIKIAYI